MPDAPPGPPDPGPHLAIVKSTHLAPGRPRVRITRAMPAWMTPEMVVQVAQSRAREDTAHRFQVLHVEPGGPEPRVLWDSHAPS